MNDSLILHHYDTSPFSEKIRVALGMKSAAWRSVKIPNIMPKPDLMPLTGGYRRTPVAQAGADVFCDTQVILAEVERMTPEPRLVGGLDWAVNLWADRPFFMATVPIIFGSLKGEIDPAFAKDREQLSGRPFDPNAMRAAVGPMKQQWRAQAAWLNQQLAADGAWLAGERPGLADAAAYMNIWFLERNAPQIAAELLQGLDAVQAWKRRVAEIGHGAPSELDSTAALEIARTAEPRGTDTHDPADPLGLSPGAAAFVMADDYGRDRVLGRLVAANPERVVIAREDPAVGLVHVHFPRAGYIAGPA
ncbi:glutathione S-transferase family protein [Phenylobacterium montanum]|uniref:Glutathione S-transferase family protein n=1 Tax=Phenylobacterium montanum TaxID=2823693 RepID=A0A975FXQ7_9CAUL|nr:glutathione S-transferase family protein [Caulobacter sp. S6]QUD87403.1 glutathione S-transferase family protein [Caulobacter sp. S6]